jgi:formylglycine-generating enzyme required for sulfatase activity/mono/diheme cytochrome c family protein
MKLSNYGVPIALAASVLWATVAASADPVDFVKDIKPIFEQNCVACHNAQHAKENGKYNMDNKADAFKPHKKEQTISPGHPDDSLVYSNTQLPASDDQHMPPAKGHDPLSKEQMDTIKRWIAEGANWPDGLKLKTVQRINFARDIQPILEGEGPLDSRSVETLRLWLEQGAPWPDDIKIGTGKTHTLPAPPEAGKKLDFVADIEPILAVGGPLSDASKAVLAAWVKQGAPWPANVTVGGGVSKKMMLVNDIYKTITAGSPEKTPDEMKPYTNTIPGTQVTYAMVPIPGGEFTMGSPDSEPNRNADEGPQHRVKIEPFWMEKTEVTWAEYQLFMYPDENKPNALTYGTSNYTGTLSDAVTRPTKPYVEMSFGMGKDGYPAISMTQHGCNIYCQWLSAKTGHFYRLPTEAEWEYACRAGTTTAYFFGNDPAQLGDYAWFGDNSDGKYQKVGTKKPNPWGLYDMLGNVDEWTLDQYDPDYYKKFTDVVTEPWNKSTAPYPQVVRGGSWEDDPDKLRCACRRGSSPDWKMQDPQLPKSIWYHTDAKFLGFRIIRPLKIPSAAEMERYWHSGVEKD